MIKQEDPRLAEPTVTTTVDGYWLVHYDGETFGPYNKTEAEECLDRLDFVHRVRTWPWFLHPMFWWTLAGLMILGPYSIEPMVCCPALKSSTASSRATL